MKTGNAHSTAPSAETPTLGRYELVRRLAEGGMAEIFLARTTGIEGFEKIVVLKRILPHFALDRRFVRMFLQEAKLAASLHHNNIVQVYDIGKSGGTYFFTMEYVHGIDVRHLLRALLTDGNPMPLEHAIWIVKEAAAGLHYAHEMHAADGTHIGVVHRDVSPSNLLLGHDGSVKVADFGIAKATQQRSETRSGTLRGKVAYMSPEQCNSGALDRRSDLFSLGIILYELSTGVLPFRAEGEFALLKQIIEDPPPSPSSIVSGYPAELERIVMRALAKRPEDRYQTTREMQAELETFAHAHRLLLSPLALASYVERTMGDRAVSWHRARNAGMTLAQHVTSALELEEQEGEPLRGAILVDETLAGEDLVPAVPPIRLDRTGRRSRWLLPAAALALVGTAAVGILFAPRRPELPQPAVTPPGAAAAHPPVIDLSTPPAQPAPARPQIAIAKDDDPVPPKRTPKRTLSSARNRDLARPTAPSPRPSAPSGVTTQEIVPARAPKREIERGAPADPFSAPVTPALLR